MKRSEALDGSEMAYQGFYIENGRTATFGRKGSDYLTAVIARSVQASELVLYKDVKWFMSTYPVIVPYTSSDMILFFIGVIVSFLNAKASDRYRNRKGC